MSVKLCRFCLGNENLKLLFQDYKHFKKYSVVLKRTTGLNIHLNDGFPQTVCEQCTTFINLLHNFQNKCLKSEQELNKLGYEKNNDIRAEKKENQKNKITKEIADVALGIKYENIEEIYGDSLDNLELPNLEVSVEFDRLSQNEEQDGGNNEAQVEDIKPKNIKEGNKMNRKEKRELYLSLIDGKFDPKGPIRCKVCKKSVSRWTSFITHSKLHLGFNYVCEFCGKSFISITQLKRHCRSHHGMKRELQCLQCNYLALDNTQLNLHIRSAHTGERPYICDYCEASYFSRKCLIQHIENHLSEKSVQCGKCPKKFKSRRHLSKHIYNTHTSKEFTYQCPICYQTYRNSKYIGVHLRKLHGVTKKDVKIIKTKL